MSKPLTQRVCAWCVTTAVFLSLGVFFRITLVGYETWRSAVQPDSCFELNAALSYVLCCCCRPSLVIGAHSCSQLP